MNWLDCGWKATMAKNVPKRCVTGDRVPLTLFTFSDGLIVHVRFGCLCSSVILYSDSVQSPAIPSFPANSFIIGSCLLRIRNSSRSRKPEKFRVLAFGMPIVASREHGKETHQTRQVTAAGQPKGHQGRKWRPSWETKEGKEKQQEVQRYADTVAAIILAPLLNRTFIGIAKKTARETRRSAGDHFPAQQCECEVFGPKPVSRRPRFVG